VLPGPPDHGRRADAGLGGQFEKCPLVGDVVVVEPVTSDNDARWAVSAERDAIFMREPTDGGSAGADPLADVLEGRLPITVEVDENFFGRLGAGEPA
jgi:hypothetical protein